MASIFAFCPVDARINDQAERGIIERMTIDAPCRASRYDATSAILRDRLKQRGGHMDHFPATRFETLNIARELAAQQPDFLHL